MPDICAAVADLVPAEPAMIDFVMCFLPAGHEGPHFDRIEGVAWRVPTSRAIPRVTQAYLRQRSQADA